MSTATRRAETGTCREEPADAQWGRLPGAEPPLRWRLPALVFAGAAAVLTWSSCCWSAVRARVTIRTRRSSATGCC